MMLQNRRQLPTAISKVVSSPRPQTATRIYKSRSPCQALGDFGIGIGQDFLTVYIDVKQPYRDQEP